MPKQPQDMCPICVKPFGDGDVLIEYLVWGDDEQKLAHVRCVMILATPEKETSKRK
jgi:hypothetical protein